MRAKSRVRASASKSADRKPPVAYDKVAPTEEAIEFCAMLAHSALAAYRGTMNEDSTSWQDSTADQRASVTSGVEYVLANPEATPEDQHNEWMAHKQKAGWRWGQIKSASDRTHPCLAPYLSLSQFQRTKDVIFHAIVKSFFGLVKTEETPSE